MYMCVHVTLSGLSRVWRERGSCFIFTFFNEHMKHIGGKWLRDGKVMRDVFTRMGDGFTRMLI